MSENLDGIEYTVANQKIDPNLAMVTPEIEPSSTSSSADSAASSENDAILPIVVNPIKRKNYPGSTNRSEVLERANTYFKDLPVAEFDSVVKDNALDIMKAFRGLAQYWNRKFLKEKETGKEKLLKMEEEKDKRIKKLEQKNKDLGEDIIEIESKQRRNRELLNGFESDESIVQLIRDLKVTQKKLSEVEKDFEHEKSAYDDHRSRSKRCREDLKFYESENKKLEESNEILKAEAKENVLKLNQLEKKLKNLHLSCIEKDDEIENLKFLSQIDMKNFQEQIKELTKVNQERRVEMQNLVENEQLLNLKCTQAEAEAAKLIKDVTNEKNKLLGHVQAMIKDREFHQSEMQNLAAKEQKLTEKCSKLEVESTKMERMLKVAKNENAELQEKLENANKNVEEMEKKIQDSEAQNLESENKFNETMQKNAKLQSKLETSEADNQSLIQKCAKLEAEVAKLKEMQTEKKFVEELTEKCAVLEAQISESERNLYEMKQKNEELIAELQTKLKTSEADTQSLIQKCAKLESAALDNTSLKELQTEKRFVEELVEKCAALEAKVDENERKFNEMNQKNVEAELGTKQATSESDYQILIQKCAALEAQISESLTNANKEITELKEKLEVAEKNEKGFIEQLNAAEDEKRTLSAKVFALETSDDFYKKELDATRIRLNTIELIYNEQVGYINALKKSFNNMHSECQKLLKKQNYPELPTFQAVSGPETNIVAAAGDETGQNGIQTTPGNELNNQIAKFNAQYSFMEFENNQLQIANSNLKNAIATLQMEYEKLQKKILNIEEYLNQHGKNLLSSIEANHILEICENFRALKTKLEEEKNLGILKQALLVQLNLTHLDEKKKWILVFNEINGKLIWFKGENLKLGGELKYYREAFSSSGSSDETVVPRKRKRKSQNPERQQVQPQQQQLAITDKLPESNNNAILVPTPNSLFINNQTS